LKYWYQNGFFKFRLNFDQPYVPVVLFVVLYVVNLYCQQIMDTTRS